MNLWSQIDISVRLFAPRLLAVLLIIITFLPLRIQGISSFIPMVDIIMIYYWCIHRPQLMPQWFVFLLGLFQDTFYGIALGTSSLTNIILRAIVVSQRRLFVKESFFVIWCGLIVFSLGASIFKWLIFTILAGELYFPEAVLIQWLLTILLYPPLHWLCNVIATILPEKQSNA